MESIHRFPRPLSTYRVADKAQNPSAVKYLLSLVTGRKSRSSSKEDFVHPSIQPRIPNIRQTSVVSSCNDEEDDNNSGMDKRYEINAVDRTRTDVRVTSVARENRGIRMSNNQVVSQCIESSFPPDEKYGNLLNKRIPASSDGTPGSPPSSSSSIRSITSTFVPRKSDKVMPEKPAISLVHNSIGISSPHSHSSKIMQQNSNCRPQLRHQQQYGNYLEGHQSNQYDQQIPAKVIVIPFSSSNAPLQGQSQIILPKIRGGDKSENRVTKGTDVLCCDKCDGRHETAICPHYKKKREGHIDAQKNGWKLVGGSSPLPGIFELCISRQSLLCRYGAA